MSRSWFVWHFGHVHIRVDRGSSSITNPHAEHVLVDGKNCGRVTISQLYHCPLYVSMFRKVDQEASAICLDRCRFLSMFSTDKLSMPMAWFSRIRRVESLC